MIHERENNSESEMFLKDNGEKFKGDCLTVMRLLFSGIRLTARALEKEYDIDGRRLRDVIKARRDIVKKEKVVGADGKGKFMEYYIEKLKPPTKAELIQKWFDEFQNEKAMTIAHQLSLYETQFR